MNGCIYHFVKWQIHPFISKGTIYIVLPGNAWLSDPLHDRPGHTDLNDTSAAYRKTRMHETETFISSAY